MKSWLQIQGETIDGTMLAKHLQVRGTLSGSQWTFEMPGRLLDRPLSHHIRHWMNFLQKHAEGRRALQKLDYRFALHFLGSLPVAFTHDEIDLIARVHCGVVIENQRTGKPGAVLNVEADV